jgi:hypothetical protein
MGAETYTQGLMRVQESHLNLFMLSDGEVGITTHIARVNADQVDGGLAEARANLDRLAAAWNACAGIPTSALKAGVVSDAIEASEVWKRVHDRLFAAGYPLTQGGKPIDHSDMNLGGAASDRVARKLRGAL